MSGVARDPWSLICSVFSVEFGFERVERVSGKRFYIFCVFPSMSVHDFSDSRVNIKIANLKFFTFLEIFS